MKNGEVPPDGFRGDNEALKRSVAALLALDSAGSLVPHGIGGHARTLLTAAYHRLPEKSVNAMMGRVWMLFGYLLAALAFLFLAGCGEAPEKHEARVEGMKAWSKIGENAYVLTDRETGCEYVVVRGYREQSMSPRLNSDGTAKCK